MQKTPSYLKGLAETRARAAADVLRYKQVLKEVKASLDQAEAEVEACDMLIRKFDERLDPSQIEPIHHWEGRYGRRGALKAAVLALIQERSPAPVTTTEIAWQMQIQFLISFSHWRERKTWATNSVGNTLKALVREGLIERCPELRVVGRSGSWRAATTPVSLPR